MLCQVSHASSSSALPAGLRNRPFLSIRLKNSLSQYLIKPRGYGHGVGLRLCPLANEISFAAMLHGFHHLSQLWISSKVMGLAKLQQQLAQPSRHHPSLRSQHGVWQKVAETRSWCNLRGIVSLHAHLCITRYRIAKVSRVKLGLRVPGYICAGHLTLHTYMYT